MKKNLLIASSVLAVASAASADFVDVACTGLGAGAGVSVSLNGNGYNGFAGQILLALSNSTGADVNGSWTSYCTEIGQHISVGGASQTYALMNVADLPTPGLGMGTARADAISRMYKFANGAQFGGNNEYAAAFQVAIWEISNDYDGTLGSLSLSTGSLLGSVNGTIDGYLTTLFGAAADTNGALANIVGLGNESYQDQIIEVPGGIPAPGALALLGVAGVVGSRRRRA
jgi:hypothetical protein